MYLTVDLKSNIKTKRKYIKIKMKMKIVFW